MRFNTGGGWDLEDRRVNVTGALERGEERCGGSPRGSGAWVGLGFWLSVVRRLVSR